MSIERSISVLLSANVAGYIAKMREAGVATESAMGKASRATSVHGKALGALGAVARGTGIAVAGGLAIAVKEATEFNAKMALVQTLSHANAREMRMLSAEAKNAGLAYGYTASQVADGEAEMIKAGVSLKDIMGGGLKGTLALAAAGQTDVATATTIAASAMTQFKLKGKDIPHIADLLAAGADKALGSVEDLGYGLEQSGTTAHQMGISVEETTGVLAAFAQAGLIGERGGTTFKQMLLQLASPTKQSQKLMDQYGLSLYKANGEIKSMPELAANLQKSFEHLTPAQRNAALGTIFGTRAIQGANIMLADGQKGIAGWIRKVNDQGFAAHQASGKLNSLGGDLQKLKGAAENAFIGLGQGSQNPLRHFVQDATTEIEKLTRNHTLEKWGRDAGKAIGTIVTEAGPLAKDVGHALKVVGGGVKTVADGFNSLPKGVQSAIVTGGIAAYGAHKLGIDSLLKGVIGSRKSGLGGGSGVLGLLSSAKPVPVLVVNKGFGGGGGLPGEGGLPGKGADVGEEVGKLGTWAAGGALATGTVATAGVAALGFMYYEMYKQRKAFDAWRKQHPYTDLSAHAAPLTGGALQIQNNVAKSGLIFGTDTAAQKVRKLHSEVSTMNAALGVAKDKAQTLGPTVRRLGADVQGTGMQARGTGDQAHYMNRVFGQTPKDVNTNVRAPGLPGALSGALALNAELHRINGTTSIATIITRHEQQTFNQTFGFKPPGQKKAFGGQISGWSPNPRADNIPIAATAGEHMWSVAEVAGAGGHAAMERMRYLARSGQLQGFADGGAIRASSAPAPRYTQTVIGGQAATHVTVTLPESIPLIVDGEKIDARIDRRAWDVVTAHHTYPTGPRRGHR